jgi:hypothetical protein
MEDDETYEVEELLEKKLDEQGKEIYKVKWKGYPESDATWEPIENINDQEVID